MAIAVIGAAFGDEGKGLVTDAWCSQNDIDLVVRYNGGAQAGHTVTHGVFSTVAEDGKATQHQIRHVFHHYGSGVLRGAFTYLGRRFVCNPMLFGKERRELTELIDALAAAFPHYANAKGNFIGGMVYADPRCFVTTPYDMLINEMIESKRGGSRHGSCGVGFGETIERSEHHWPPPLTVLECSEEKYLRETLSGILKEWVPYRMDKLGLKPEDDKLRWEYMNSETIRERWIEDALDMRSKMVLQGPKDMLPHNDILFEGAQGLLLDQDSKFFPHVTRSKTGLPYVKEMIEEANEDTNHNIRLNSVVYVIRSFMTRHGAGPFPTEFSGLGDYYKKDLTNVPNDWQGTLRQGDLALDDIKEAVDKDFESMPDRSAADAELFVTWMDHPSVKDRVEDFVVQTAGELDLEVLGWSEGPSQGEVTWF